MPIACRVALLSGAGLRGESTAGAYLAWVADGGLAPAGLVAVVVGADGQVAGDSGCC